MHKRRRSFTKKGENEESGSDLALPTKRMRIARMQRMQNGYGNNRIFRYKRSVSLSPIQINMDGATYSKSVGAYSFKLDDTPGYADFTTLYDRYRISGVKLHLFPRISQQTVAGNAVAATSYTPPIGHAVDYDDTTAPTAITDLQQYENFRIQSEFKPFTIYIKPRLAIAVYNGSVFTSYGNANPKQWIDAASPSVPYYGWKWATMTYSTSCNGNQYWDIVATYYLEFMNPR